MKSEPQFYVICAQSGVQSHRMCYIGGGATKKDAQLDAYGEAGKTSRNHVMRDYASQEEAAQEFGDSVYY